MIEIEVGSDRLVAKCIFARKMYGKTRRYMIDRLSVDRCFYTFSFIHFNPVPLFQRCHSTFLYGMIMPSVILPPIFFFSFLLRMSAPTAYMPIILPFLFCGKS